MFQPSFVFSNPIGALQLQPGRPTHDAGTFLRRDTDGLLIDVSDDDVLLAAERILERRFAPRTKIAQPTEVANYFRAKLACRPRELFAVIYLDAAMGIIAYEEMFEGTTDQAMVYPREVIKSALAHNACNVVISHQHPSGNCEPSPADRRLTDILKKALDMVDIRLLDHILVAGTKTYSFAEHGFM